VRARRRGGRGGRALGREGGRCGGAGRRWSVGWSVRGCGAPLLGRAVGVVVRAWWRLSATVGGAVGRGWLWRRGVRAGGRCRRLVSSVGVGVGDGWPGRFVGLGSAIRGRTSGFADGRHVRVVCRPLRAGGCRFGPEGSGRGGIRVAWCSIDGHEATRVPWGARLSGERHSPRDVRGSGASRRSAPNRPPGARREARGRHETVATPTRSHPFAANRTTPGAAHAPRTGRRERPRAPPAAHPPPPT
jgi:hypothetical protein